MIPVRGVTTSKPKFQKNHKSYKTYNWSRVFLKTFFIISACSRGTKAKTTSKKLPDHNCLKKRVLFAMKTTTNLTYSASVSNWGSVAKETCCATICTVMNWHHTHQVEQLWQQTLELWTKRISSWYFIVCLQKCQMMWCQQATLPWDPCTAGFMGRCMRFYEGVQEN